MRRANQPPPPAIVVHRHPPERLVRALARGEVAACCTTSSCCCCLHSLGGLAGAIVGTYHPALPSEAGEEEKGIPPVGLRDDELDGPAPPAPARPGPRPLAVPIYWCSATGLTFLTILGAPLISPQRGPNLGFGLLIFFGPVVLLGGSVIAALVIAGSPSLRGDVREWKRLGWITLGMVVGTLLGTGLMLLPLIGRR